MSVKRFNYALDNIWYANEVQYKADYLKSIVFIHKSNADSQQITKLLYQVLIMQPPQ